MQERTIHITLECSVYNSDRESSCTLSKTQTDYERSEGKRTEDSDC